jgi:hypothetical protein
MKRLILILSLASTAMLGACAELRSAMRDDGADAGATGVEQQRPYPKSMNLG